jgi:hypothetical protein
MLGALLVLVGMIASFWGGVVLIVEATDPVYRSLATPSSGETNLLLMLGVALTFAGGITLLLSSPRRLA